MTPSELTAMLLDRKLIFNAIDAERHHQDEKWGVQQHPNGTCEKYLSAAAGAKVYCDTAFAKGSGTWADILKEEVYEALSETNELKLRNELIQVAAVCVAWIECIQAKGLEQVINSKEGK